MARSKISTSNINWGTTPSGSAAGGGSYLVLNSSGRLVLDQGGGGSVSLDIISGSSLTYHNLSGSSGTFNSIDVDRVVTNQISGSTATINTISGSVGIFHNLSGSTGKFNSLDIDRIITNQISGSTAIANTISGSVGVIHSISGSTGKFNLVDVDKITAGQINTTSFTGSGGMMIGDNNADDLSILAGLITDLLPQNNEGVNLGSAAKQYGVLFAASASIGDNVGIGGTITVGENATVAGIVSGSTLTSHVANIDKVVAKQTTTTSLTASFAKITSLDVENILSRTITKESLEIKDNLIIAAISGSKAGNFIGAGFQVGGTSGVQGTGSNPLMSLTLGSRKLTGDSLIVNVDGQAGASFMSGSATMASLGTAGMRFGVTGSISGSLIQAKKAEIGAMHIQHMSSSKVSTQTLHVFGEISGSGTNTLIKKNHIHRNVVQNNTDSHGGLSFSGGRLSIGIRKMIFVRSDGSNISGSIPTKGMFATHAMPTPYTTASLASQPQSGSLMVYLNGVLLHGDHPGQNTHGPTSADYRVVTASNAYKVLMHEELALDGDDILTVTFFSGSGVSS
tara:strand:- start:1592 stop:3292 length:1701 start_codon:yes stop_codon:yes gene_type:complete